MKLTKQEDELIEMFRSSTNPVEAIAEAIKVILCYAEQHEPSRPQGLCPVQEQDGII